MRCLDYQDLLRGSRHLVQRQVEEPAEAVRLHNPASGIVPESVVEALPWEVRLASAPEAEVWLESPSEDADPALEAAATGLLVAEVPVASAAFAAVPDLALRSRLPHPRRPKWRDGCESPRLGK